MSRSSIGPGQKTMANSEPVVISSDQSAIPVTGPLTDAQLRATPVPVSGTVTTGGLTDAQLRATPVPISGTVTTTPSATPQDTNITQILGAAPSATNPLSSRLTDGTAFLTNLGQTAATGQFNKITDGTDTALVTAAGELNTIATAQPGVDIGDVTVNNAAGAAAVNIQDGGNSITVDGTFFQATQPISAATLPLPTGAATEATLASIDAGIPAALGQGTMATSMKVVIASDQTAVPVSGTVTITPSGTQDINQKQVNGATINVGVGTAGTGTQRVTTSTDSTIGTVTAVTAITNALPSGTNVIGHIIADTGSTTAVTGNVTVVQPTGTNLHVVTDSGTITTVSTVTAVTAITNALPAGTNLLGKVGIDQTTPGVTNGVVVSQTAQGTTSTESTIAASATSVTLHAANTARKSIAIRNDGTGILYVSKTATATTSAVIKLLQDDVVIIDNYSGIITGIWTSFNGNAQVEETT